MNHAEEIKALRQQYKSFKDSLKPLVQLLDVDLSDLEGVSALKDRLEKASLAKLIPEPVQTSLQQLKTSASDILDKTGKAFGQIESSFISAVKEKGYQLKELDQGWRVDSLELEFRRYQCSVSFKYNHESITEWLRVSSAEQLLSLFDDARKSINETVLDSQARNQLFWEAYRQAAWLREKDKIKSPETVPILDFFRECNVIRYRNQLAGSKKKEGELSKVAFLRNLDEYSHQLEAIPANERLTFQTASQSQQSKGIGVSLGGLNPKGDYRTICYIVHIEPRS